MTARKGVARSEGEAAGWGFVLEEPAFAFEAAAVACEGAVGADDAVTGDHDTDGVGSVGEAYGADRGGATDALRELAVGRGGAGGDFAEGAPDFALEWGAGGLDWKGVDRGEVTGEVAVEGFG